MPPVAITIAVLAADLGRWWAIAAAFVGIGVAAAIEKRRANPLWI